jgi:hypothetical protein
MRITAIVFASFLFSMALQAQSTFSTLRGFVLDPQGAGVPGAHIEARNEETGIVRATSSGEDGAWEIGYLQPGRYTLQAEKIGFQRFEAEDIRLFGTGVAVFDIRLSIGDVSTSVTVTSEPNAVSEEAGQVAVVSTQQQYLDTPINTRGSWDSYLFSFMSFVPGVQPSTAQFNLMFAGTRGAHNNFTVDGISSRSITFGNVNGPAFPSMESILEVRTNVSGNSAEYSFPAQVTVVSRGGTNKFHGSAFWYYSSAGLNARPYFSPPNPFALLQNAGARLSGPIVRSKTFFLGTYEYFEDRTSATLALNVPSRNMRQGNFSALPAPVRDPLNGQPLPGNVIPQARLNAAALRIQDRFFPAPNFGDALLVAGNYRDYIKQRQGRHTYDFRLDHHFGTRNILWLRGSHSRNPDERIAGLLPAVGRRDNLRRTWNAVVSNTHVLSAFWINEFRAGLSFQHLPSRGRIMGYDIIQQLGLTGLPPGTPNVPAIPTFNIAGFTVISMSEFRETSDQIVQIQNNLSWYRGNHTIKFGMDIWRNLSADHPTAPSAGYGNIQFNGSYTGHPYADFLTGIPRQASRGAAGLWRSRRRNVDWNFFIQDDWRVSPRLTLSAGLRYSVNPPYTEEEGRIFNWNPFTNRLVLPNANSLRYLNAAFVASGAVPLQVAQDAGLPESTLVRTDRNNWSPRLGFAYRLTEDGRTVFRGSYGVFYHLHTAQMWNALARGPFTGTETSPPNQIVNGVPLWQLPDLFPRNLALGATATIGGIDPDYRNPMLQQWNATLERQQFGVVFRAAYLAMKAHGLQIFRNLNQPPPSTIPFTPARRPYPTLGVTNYRENLGNAYYNGLLLVAERRLANGLVFQFGHTWSRNLTDAHFEIDDGGRLQDILNRRAEWAEYGTNRRHRFTGTVQYQIPSGRSLPGWLRWAAQDWLVASAFVFQTGQWFHPTISGIDPANVGVTGSRPDRLRSGALPNPTIDRWFDLTAFVPPPSGRFGNCGVHILEGPGTKLWNAGLFRSVALRERLRLRVEATFTNVTNTPNFGQPATNLANPDTAGRITSTQFIDTAGARTLRLGARFEF